MVNKTCMKKQKRKNLLLLICRLFEIVDPWLWIFGLLLKMLRTDLGTSFDKVGVLLLLQAPLQKCRKAAPPLKNAAKHPPPKNATKQLPLNNAASKYAVNAALLKIAVKQPSSKLL